MAIEEFECCSSDNAFFNRRMTLGFYGDYVINRHLETVHDKDIDYTKLLTHAGIVAMNFCDRLAIFSTLGVTRLSLNTSLGAFNLDDTHPLFEIETLSSFSYSVGAKAKLWSYKKFSLGAVGQYFSTSPRIKRLYIASGASSYPDKVLKTHYSEWQLALGVSYHYNARLIPYGAVKYAHAHWKLNNGKRFIIETNTNTFLHNLRNQRPWGYALGLTYYPILFDCFMILAEIRFLDETAIHLNLQTRF